MAKFMSGDVVVLPFPFSDVSGVKRRPALVLAELPFSGGMDYLVCVITTRNVGDPHALELLPADLLGGTLAVRSYLRPLYLFATDEGVIVRKIGMLALAKLHLVKKTVRDVLHP